MEKLWNQPKYTAILVKLKVWYMHTMKYYGKVKRKRVDLYELMGKDVLIRKACYMSGMAQHRTDG